MNRHAGGSRPRRVAALGITTGVAMMMAAGLASCAGDPPPSPAPASVPSARPDPALDWRLDGPDRLVTNEFAHWNGNDPRRVASPVWQMTSGSLFVRGGVGYSGVPDTHAVDPRSEQGTNSAVFRLSSVERDFRDVSVTARLRLLRFTNTGSHEWDGVHVWLRYHSEERLYVASVARRDGTVAVKRKDPGGPSNGGTYRTLGQQPHVLTLNQWHTVLVSIRNLDAKRVAVTMTLDDRPALTVIDTGRQGKPLTTAGAIGIRADNAEFELADIRATKM